MLPAKEISVLMQVLILVIMNKSLFRFKREIQKFCSGKDKEFLAILNP
jgi:hypothetical protein